MQHQTVHQPARWQSLRQPIGAASTLGYPDSAEAIALTPVHDGVSPRTINRHGARLWSSRPWSIIGCISLLLIGCKADAPPVVPEVQPPPPSIPAPADPPESLPAPTDDDDTESAEAVGTPTDIEAGGSGAPPVDCEKTWTGADSPEHLMRVYLDHVNHPDDVQTDIDMRYGVALCLAMAILAQDSFKSSLEGLQRRTSRSGGVIRVSADARENLASRAADENLEIVVEPISSCRGQHRGLRPGSVSECAKISTMLGDTQVVMYAVRISNRWLAHGPVTAKRPVEAVQRSIENLATKAEEAARTASPVDIETMVGLHTQPMEDVPVQNLTHMDEYNRLRTEVGLVDVTHRKRLADQLRATLPHVLGSTGVPPENINTFVEMMLQVHPVGLPHVEGVLGAQGR